MNDEQLADAICALVSEHIGVGSDRIFLDTDIVKDIDGDDVSELIEAYGKEFSVDLSNYRWYHHSGLEGCNPLWLVFPPWWTWKTHVPIRLQDLIDSERQATWTITYPEHERQYSPSPWWNRWFG